MKNFSELMATAPPRVEVHFQRGLSGEERFQWGITDGGMPILTVIGAITRVQAELPLLEPGDTRHKCDQQILVLVWDAELKMVRWFVGPNIPTDPLLGILETIKDLLVSSQLAQRATSQQSRVLGYRSDGSPIK